MKVVLKKRKLDELFIVKSGDIHATSELDSGSVPLISCGNVGQGFLGNFDIPQNCRYRHSLTVAYNGSWPLLAKFHPYEFGAKDDVAVLIPREPLKDSTLLYVAALLNSMTWRYSYYRHCYRDKVRKTVITLPMISVEKEYKVDESYIAKQFSINAKSLIPLPVEASSIPPKIAHWEMISVATLFDIERGCFHSLAALEPGEYPTVSRIAVDNGVVGYFQKPDKAKVYMGGKITVSTVGGDAFVQLQPFLATDNVLILTPKSPMKLATLFCVAFMLNQQKWRYSYGRQCYKAKFAVTQIWMPGDSAKILDVQGIEGLAHATSYWSVIRDVNIKGRVNSKKH
jgi:hypothetical protein